jgi:hypothetical protein
MTVRYVRLLACVVDAARSFGRIEAAFVGSAIAVSPWVAEHEPNRLPDWYAVHFTADHGDYERLRAGVVRQIDAAGLADEFKPEGVDA